MTHAHYDMDAEERHAPKSGKTTSCETHGFHVPATKKGYCVHCERELAELEEAAYASSEEDEE
jgi:hypothetical protein